MILGIRTQREVCRKIRSMAWRKLDGHVDRHERSAGRADKENGSSRQQMQNQQSENQDMKETESESSKESGADSQGTESTGAKVKRKQRFNRGKQRCFRKQFRQ